VKTCKTWGSVLSRTETNLEDITGQEHAKRALEVALASDHTIAFFGNDDAEALAEAATRLGATAWAMRPCPCGHWGLSDYTHRECACSLSMVSKWHKRKAYQNARNADIVVDCPPAYDYQIDAWVSGRRSEPEAALLARVKDRGELPLVHLDGTSRSLLKAAVKQLGMEMRRVKATLRVAQTIAALARCEKIEAYHLAEAIQYRPRHNR